MQVDVAILGGGAAGLFCAAEAAARGRRVLVIEGTRTAGEKIRISGGGRCNFTNLHISGEKFLSCNPHFALSALNRFTQWDFISRVNSAGISWHEKTLGQLFCDGSSREILQMLLDALNRAGGLLWLGTTIIGVKTEKNGYSVETSRGIVEADRVVVATGGKSIPKMGATGIGYRIAEDFGIPVQETRPALVPLTFATQELERLKPLAGIAVPGIVNCGRTYFEESLLFTHRGLSGPAILQISSYWREGDEISVDLAPGRDLIAELRRLRGQNGKLLPRRALAAFLPERLARDLESRANLHGNLADQNNDRLSRLAAQVTDWRLRPVGSEGYRTAEVTLGGVDTDALNPRTMEARNVPGLYFIGEVVDVTGWLGGYNFQWAWSSAWVAGQVV
ncbi:MAG: NAD(P)/FAD-dependent oxidoreductase [Pseudorhodobacter sp.]